jgi:hypothetical protein
MAVSEDAKLISAAILTLAVSIEASEEQGTKREVIRKQGLERVLETFRTMKDLKKS